MTNRFTLIMLVLCAGASWPIQSIVNGQLRISTRQPMIASLINGGGAAVLAGMILLIGGLALKRLALPSGAELSSVPWWAWGGGLFSVLVIVAQSAASHSLGTATLISLFVSAQAVSALLVDHFGLLGIPAKPVSLQRLVGVALLVAGAVMLTRGEKNEKPVLPQMQAEQLPGDEEPRHS